MRHDPLSPFPAPSVTELWYPSSLQWPADGSGGVHPQHSSKPAKWSSWIYPIMQQKSPEVSHWPLELKGWEGGEGGRDGKREVWFLLRPLSLIEWDNQSKPLLTWWEQTTVSCLLALADTAVRMSCTLGPQRIDPAPACYLHHRANRSLSYTTRPSTTQHYV